MSDVHVAAALEVAGAVLELLGEQPPLFGLFPHRNSTAGIVARRVMLASIAAGGRLYHAAWVGASPDERRAAFRVAA